MSAVIKTSTSTTLVSGTTTVLNKPTGTVDGDLLITIVAALNNNRTITTLAGWTLVDTMYVASVDTVSVYSKIASSEPSTYTWTASNTCNMGGAVLRVIDFDVSTPIDVHNTANGTTLSPTYANTITPTRSDNLLIMVVGSGSPNTTDTSAYAITTSNPTWTELYDLNNSGTQTVGVAYAVRNQTTATGNSSATLGGSSSYGSGCVILSVKRTLAYTLSLSETAVTTDNLVSMPRTRVFSVSDTQATIDSIIAAFGSRWTKITKSISSWINDTRHQ